MPEEKQVADAPQANEAAARPAKRRRRMSAPLVVAALIMFLAMASYFANGVSLLLELDVFTRGLGNASVAAGALTPEGQRLVLGGVYLFFGALALIFLIGFLLRRRVGLGRHHDLDCVIAHRRTGRLLQRTAQVL